jgi:hypothetical protein
MGKDASKVEICVIFSIYVAIIANYGIRKYELRSTVRNRRSLFGQGHIDGRIV